MIKNKKGFSLIEIMVVTIMVSTLMGVVVMKYQKSVSNANVQKTLAELRTLKFAVAKYYDKNNAFPVATSVTSGNTNSIDSHLNGLYDGSLTSRWFADCGNAGTRQGVLITAHHLKADLMYKLVTEFANQCAYGSGSVASDPTYGNYVYCRIKPASEITNVNYTVGAVSQCRVLP